VTAPRSSGTRNQKSYDDRNARKRNTPERAAYLTGCPSARKYRDRKYTLPAPKKNASGEWCR
jgi:hypothetical protein